MRILMVCLGNICRSPLAEGILRKKLQEAGLDQEVSLDSCGTNGLHNGESPDDRSQENALSNGVDISNLVSRQIQKSDLERFDKILCMDTNNLETVRSMSGSKETLENISLIMDSSRPGENCSIPDPYFGGEAGFQLVFDMLEEACASIVQDLAR